MRVVFGVQHRNKIALDVMLIPCASISSTFGIVSFPLFAPSVITLAHTFTLTHLSKNRLMTKYARDNRRKLTQFNAAWCRGFNTDYGLIVYRQS